MLAFGIFVFFARVMLMSAYTDGKGTWKGVVWL
jgi:hypothetical protein